MYVTFKGCKPTVWENLTNMLCYWRCQHGEYQRFILIFLPTVRHLRKQTVLNLWTVTHQSCCSVLLQVTDNFDRQDFNKMCWTLCFRKNMDQSQLFISNDDAFKIWCIFNFLSEDRYPLVIVTEEVSGNQYFHIFAPKTAFCIINPVMILFKLSATFFFQTLVWPLAHIQVSYLNHGHQGLTCKLAQYWLMSLLGL